MLLLLGCSWQYQLSPHAHMNAGRFLAGMLSMHACRPSWQTLQKTWR